MSMVIDFRSGKAIVVVVLLSLSSFLLSQGKVYRIDRGGWVGEVESTSVFSQPLVLDGGVEDADFGFGRPKLAMKVELLADFAEYFGGEVGQF